MLTELLLALLAITISEIAPRLRRLPLRLFVLTAIALVVMTAVQIAALPVYSLLEGCDQIDASYRFKLAQAVLGTP